MNDEHYLSTLKLVPLSSSEDSASDHDDDDIVVASSRLDDDNSDDNKPRKTTKKKKKGGFHAMNLSDAIMAGLRRQGYKQPTPIQRKAVPLVTSGRDIVAMARTGSGKTMAFLIPVLDKLAAHSPAGARALILSPTRELAQQTYRNGIALGRDTGLRLCLLQGGDAMEAQFEALSSKPDVLVATPGRLAHLLVEASDFGLDKVEFLVFDEADRLFEMGFQAQIADVMARTPPSRQTLLFSATMPKSVAEFARAGLRDPELVRLDTDARLSENLKLAFFKVRTGERYAALLSVLERQMDCAKESTIVFCSTKHQAEYVAELLRACECCAGVQGEDRGVGVAHGSMDQAARTEALQAFRQGRTKVLVVTDLAARGLDIPHVNNVVNVDFPDKAKLFVHRVGRAARQGRKGTAFSLCTSEDMAHVADLFLYLGRPLLTRAQASSSDTHIGSLPQSLVDQLVERVDAVTARDAVLAKLRASADNARKMVLKTRAEPSKRSIRRVKEEVEQVLPVHGLFWDGKQEPEARARGGGGGFSVDLHALSRFKPKRTVFETESAKKGDAQQAVLLSAVAERMKRPAQPLPASAPTEPAFEPSEPTPAPGQASNRYREAGYISHEGGTQHYEAGFEDQLLVNGPRLEDAVLDLLPDDAQGLQARSFKWDRRKKKYVQATMKDHVQAKRAKNEAGEAIRPKDAGGIYERWRKRTRRTISGEHDGESSTDVHRLATSSRKAKRESKNKQLQPGGRKIKEELRGEDEIIKERVKKRRRDEERKGGGGKRLKGGEDAHSQRIGRQKPKVPSNKWGKSKVLGGGKGGKQKQHKRRR